MPLIRKRLSPAEVYPEDMRYDFDTDTFQRNINGEWIDAPESDPRKQTLYPPRTTSDTACDAAESVKDAFKNQLEGVLLAIDNGATAFTIAGFILGLFTFGPFGAFIGLALFVVDQMLAAGTTALEAALTEPVYDQFKCALYCNMDANGRMNEASFALAQTEINDMIGGLGAVVLNGMMQLAGYGGVNNLASLGSSTGSCFDCECEEPCPDADSFSAGTVNSITDNGDGTITFNVSSVDNGGGVQYVAWGDRLDPDSPCCTFLSQTLATGSSLGSATQACGSSVEIPDSLAPNECLHYFHFYKNFDLATPFTCDVTFEAACP